MTDTREKLLEAEYFLTRMKEEVAERDAFKHNLSAFLSAARSVTLVMQTEFISSSPGFKEWYEPQKRQMDADEAMRLMNDARVATIHHRPVQPRAHIRIRVGQTVRALVRQLSAVGKHEEASEATRPEYRWFFQEQPDQDVMTLCKEQLLKLERLVSECESQFIRVQASDD